MDRPIGVFDSGVGGLTVLTKLVQKMPSENFLYFGDTARVPYGEKSKEQLIVFTREILDWFKSQNVKAVLMACNTSSAVALDAVKDEYDFPVLGLIQPVSSHIAVSDCQKIGVMATSATVKSGAYAKYINAIDPEKIVFQQACPGLVEIVESDRVNTKEARDIVMSYVAPLLEQGVEKIVLGCTHYPYLSSLIKDIAGKDDILIDPAEFLADEGQGILDSLGLLNNALNVGFRKFYVSSSPEKFETAGSRFYSGVLAPELLDINFNCVK